MSTSFEMRASLGRHVLAVVGTASLFMLALGAVRIVRGVTGDAPNVFPALLLLLAAVAVGAALVALLLPRPTVSLDAKNLLLLGLPARRKALRFEEIAGVEGTGGWPRLKVTLRSGKQISYSLFTFRSEDRQRLLQALATVTPATTATAPVPAPG